VYLVLPRSLGKIEKYFSPKLTDYFIQGVKNVAPLRHHRGGSILEVGSGGKNNFSLHQISKRHIFAVKTS
jgi:hypothetical protein